VPTGFGQQPAPRPAVWSVLPALLVCGWLAASSAAPAAAAVTVVTTPAGDDGWDDGHHTISGAWDDLGPNLPSQPEVAD
jgi:hypothetical protein